MSKVICFAFILLLPISLSAQTLRGIWTKMLLNSNGSFPGEMAFADTNTGFIVSYGYAPAYLDFDSVRIYGIRNSKLADSTILEADGLEIVVGAGSRVFLNGFCPTPADFILLPSFPGNGLGNYYNLIFYSKDTGADWLTRVPAIYYDPKTEGQMGISVYNAMFSADTGVVLTNESGARAGNAQRFFITYDGDSSFQLLGSQVPQPVVGGYAPNTKELFAVSDTISSDTKHVREFMYHSNDSGNHWAPAYAIDTNTWKGGTSLVPMVKGHGTDHYYLTGGRVDTSGRVLDDYLESSDDGATWTSHHTVSDGRLFRIANPDSTILWAVVRNRPDSNSIPDSMFFSLDNGKTWIKDGSTFAGDTICAMQWLTATNGYVVTYRDHSTYLYHFRGNIIDSVADTSHEYVSPSVPLPDFHNRPIKLTSYPDPSHDYVHVKIPTYDKISTIHIYNAIEHELHPPFDFSNSVLTVDVRSLAEGAYFLKIAGTSGYLYFVRFSREP